VHGEPYDTTRKLKLFHESKNKETFFLARVAQIYYSWSELFVKIFRKCLYRPIGL